MPTYREMDDVAEAVRNAKRRGKKCALLIGAGCSITGGVPSAAAFVEKIRKDWPSAYHRAAKATLPASPGYPQCMAELSDAERRDLIAEAVDAAHINWAHIAIAQLMKAGVVDRIFTTNFDPLVLRACALLNQFPAVYDFAASQRFKPAYLPERSVFHLHGQHTGFVLLHTAQDVEQLSDSIAPLFEDAGRGRLWIVVGYSGENDPVFSHLAKVDHFDERLYWVGYKDRGPAPHVEEKLLSKESAFFVKGFDADDFFCVLGQRLGCFPPLFVERPFTHLTETLDTLTEYSLPEQNSRTDIRLTARILISQAVKEIEEGSARNTLLAERHLLAGNLEAVLALHSPDMSPELSRSVAWAHVMMGIALARQGRTRSGEEARALFRQAGEEYAAALAIKPGFPEALNNWGNALSDQAKTRGGVEAGPLFAQAGEKYAAALAIRRDFHEALSNWGNALLGYAKTSSGAEADALFQQAGQKYSDSLAIKPGQHQALNNWGNALSDQAKTKSGAEADALFRQADQKYAAALAIKPDFDRALANWGLALSDWAGIKTGAEADALFRQAHEKYAAALAIKPDFEEALDDWVSSLVDQANTATGEARRDLLNLARQKGLAAEALRPGSSAYNLACVAALANDPESCRQWLETGRDHKALPSREHLLGDPDLASVRESPWFLDFLSRL